MEHALAHIEEAIAGARRRKYGAVVRSKIGPFERDEKVKESLDLDPALIRHIEEDIVKP